MEYKNIPHDHKIWFKKSKPEKYFTSWRPLIFNDNKEPIKDIIKILNNVKTNSVRSHSEYIKFIKWISDAARGKKSDYIVLYMNNGSPFIKLLRKQSCVFINRRIQKYNTLYYWNNMNVYKNRYPDPYLFVHTNNDISYDEFNASIMYVLDMLNIEYLKGVDINMFRPYFGRRQRFRN